MDCRHISARAGDNREEKELGVFLLAASIYIAMRYLAGLLLNSLSNFAISII